MLPKDAHIRKQRRAWPESLWRPGGRAPPADGESCSVLVGDLPVDILRAGQTHRLPPAHSSFNSGHPWHSWHSDIPPGNSLPPKPFKSKSPALILSSLTPLTVLSSRYHGYPRQVQRNGECVYIVHILKWNHGFSGLKVIWGHDHCCNALGGVLRKIWRTPEQLHFGEMLGFPD